MMTREQIRREVETMVRRRWLREADQAAVPDHTTHQPVREEVDQAAAPKMDAGNHPPVIWVLDELLGLLTEFHDRPMNDLRPAIRSLISERAYFDHDGQALITSQPADELLDEQVDLAVAVLEKLRRQALRTGQWSDQSAAPQMCG